MVGGQGAHMLRRSVPHRRRLVPYLTLPHHRSVGATPQALSSVDPMSVCTDGHDGVVLDPWVHCHGIGALQSTLELHYLTIFDMC